MLISLRDLLINMCKIVRDPIIVIIVVHHQGSIRNNLGNMSKNYMKKYWRKFKKIKTYKMTKINKWVINKIYKKKEK